MSDFELLKDLLNRAKIDYECPDGKLILEVNRQHTHVVRGYNGFFTEFNFNKEGSLVDVGIWE